MRSTTAVSCCGLFSVVLVAVLFSVTPTNAQLACQPVTSCQNAPQPIKLPAAPIPECLCDSCPCQDEFPPLPAGVLDSRKHYRRHESSELSEESSESSEDLASAFKAAQLAKKMRIARQRELMKEKIRRHRQDLRRLREIADELKQQFRVLKQHQTELKRVIKANRNALNNFEAHSGEHDDNPLQLQYDKKSLADQIKLFEAKQLEQQHLLDRVHEFNKQAVAESLDSYEKESSNDEYDLYNVV